MGPHTSGFLEIGIYILFFLVIFYLLGIERKDLEGFQVTNVPCDPPAGPGEYCTGTSGVARICPQNNYCTGGTFIRQCALGAYCPEGTSFPSCTLPRSYYRVMAGTIRDTCEVCSPGFIVKTTTTPRIRSTTSVECQQCSAGTYAVSIENPRPVGKPTGSSGYISSCQPCPANSSCPAGSTIPTCNAGTIRVSTPSPTTVSNNVITFAIPQVSCQICSNGTYALGGATSCSICPAGSYCLSTSTLPTPCPAGTFNSTTGAISVNACLPCPPGSYCPTGSSIPIPCSSGTFGSGSRGSTAQCSGPCPTGTFCDTGYISPMICSSSLL